MPIVCPEKHCFCEKFLGTYQQMKIPPVQNKRLQAVEINQISRTGSSGDKANKSAKYEIIYV